jgi:myosin-5
LVAERQENEVTKKTLTEALDQIEELVKEVECAKNSVYQLQDNIQRLEQNASAREADLLTERQEKETTSKALAEAQAKIEGLLEEISSANKKTDLLQKTIERFVVFFFSWKHCLLPKLSTRNLLACVFMYLQNILMYRFLKQ